MKELIVRADVSDEMGVRKQFMISGLEAGIGKFIVRRSDTSFPDLGVFESIYSDDQDCPIIDIDSPDSQNDAMSFAGKKKAVIIRTGDWTIIPLENIIAAFSGSGTKVYACASDTDEARSLSGILEKGVDGIVIDVDEPENIRSFTDILSVQNTEILTEVTVKSVSQIETGDRVCIDTCVMMSPGEGMLIGSYSECLFLIQSESEDNGYVASRPFRVNAGSVHSYISVPDGRTKYISEIKSGDTVLLCDRSGKVRSAAVGRCKIERRPLLMVTASDGTNDYSVILQNAETVKLVGKNCSISVSRLKSGDRILSKIEKGGRHFGMMVSESVTEK